MGTVTTYKKVLGLPEGGGSTLTDAEVVAKSWHPTNTNWKVLYSKFGRFGTKGDEDPVNGTIPWVYSFSGGSIAASTSTYLNKIGNDTITSSTTANQLTGVEMEGDKGFRFGDARYIFGIQLKVLTVPDATDRDLITFGAADAVSTFGSNRGMWFFDPNESLTKWQAWSQGSSSNIAVTDEDIDTEWINLEIDIAGDLSDIKYYANGSLAFTEDTAVNIPPSGTAANFQIMMRQKASVAHSIEIHQAFLAYKLNDADGSFNFDLS